MIVTIIIISNFNISIIITIIYFNCYYYYFSLLLFLLLQSFLLSFGMNRLSLHSSTCYLLSRLPGSRTRLAPRRRARRDGRTRRRGRRTRQTARRVRRKGRAHRSAGRRVGRVGTQVQRIGGGRQAAARVARAGAHSCMTEFCCCRNGVHYMCVCHFDRQRLSDTSP
jgi:hypothetical protein